MYRLLSALLLLCHLHDVAASASSPMTIVRVTKNGLKEISNEVLDVFTDKIKEVRIDQVPSYASVSHMCNILKVKHKLNSPASGEMRFEGIQVHKWRKPKSTKIDLDPDDEIEYDLNDFDIGCVHHSLNNPIPVQYQRTARRHCRCRSFTHNSHWKGLH